MNYARNTLLNKKLPSFVGFFVLLGALGITVILSGNAFLFVSKAAAGSEPKNIQVSNVSDSSFTLSFTTDESVVGTISYGTDPSIPDIALDDRDQQASGATAHHVHFITIKNLRPTTKYYYVIDSGTQKTENNDKPFDITTAAALQNASSDQTIVVGTVALGDGSYPSEGIVYLTSDSSQQIATLINPDGSYKIPLSNLRSAGLTAAATLTPDTLLQLQAVTATQQSTVKVPLSQAGQVPKIVLSQNYDFTLTTQPQATQSAQSAPVSGFPVFETPSPVSSPDITTPSDSQAFKDQKPLFQGKALPNTEVDVTIQSQQEISTKLQSDSTGIWQFRPPSSLAPGKHTITIKSINAAGIIQTITRSFTVYAAGSQFVEPSVSPVASVSAIPTALPTPTTAVSPTTAITPTATPTIAVTPTPKATAVPSRAPIPKTGSSAIITGIIAGVTAMGIGALLFILTVV